ncbi:MAG: phosphogluconate dehydrogenase (NAD(+)-dependent, decarboxylating) [Thermodesulfobacteriota bacterium]
MELGMVGLGRMGANIVRRLMRYGHSCIVYDRTPDTVQRLTDEGATGTSSIAELLERMERPRAVWVMVPAGTPTEEVVKALADFMEAGDIIIDGGNAYYKDDVRRSKELKEKEIHYVDVGTSGGVWGIERGYCMMIGGEEAIVKTLDPIFKSLAPGVGDIPHTPGRGDFDGIGQSGGTAEEGYLYCGPTGAGHFVKMIHNGIEYGLMQAYAEGFGILKGAASEELPEGHRYNLDVAEIAEVWRRGSVVGSWLLDLTAMALTEDPALSNYSGFVEDSGEGRWTIMAAIEEAVPANVLSAALFKRFRSRQEQPYSDRLLSAMRQKFGGHTEPDTEE